ncbi:unnamed protein product [Nezara viridula]|uniref:Uncharacterized protein n=1 Tax=Nezara viridula TaxID=85310 RepID=A0A9P0MQF7_NEZVI|nr:unnamed protein product [Nezara viridula]
MQLNHLSINLDKLYTSIFTVIQMQRYSNEDSSRDYPHQPYSSYPKQSYPDYPQQQAQSYPQPHPSYPQQPYPSDPKSYPTYPNSPGYTNQAYSASDPETRTTMSASYVPPGGEDPTANFDFTERSIRLAFIRKVYSILTLQLLITVGFIAVFIFSPKVQNYFAQNPIYLLIAVIAVIVLSIVLCCCTNVRRSSPGNYICLLIFTIAMGFMVGNISVRYDTEAVILAAGLTAGITLGLTLFSFQTKIDFTSWGGALFALLLVLIIGGIFSAIFPSKIGDVLIGSFGAVLMSLYIIYDTQLMMGGEHKYSISPEEYIFASLNLYLDIINLFLYILRLIGGRS